MANGSIWNLAARHWYRRSALSVLLIPVAAFFGVLVSLRRWLYHMGWLESIRLPVPVLVVGNLTVGGTGKTPLVIWIARLLRAAGKSPGIVLRGYAGARTGAGPREVSPGADPALVGDEAMEFCVVLDAYAQLQ